MNDEKNTEQRRDEALRRALSSPPKPKRESDKAKAESKQEKPADK